MRARAQPTEFLIFGANGLLGRNLTSRLEMSGQKFTAYSHNPTAGQRRYDFMMDAPQTLGLRTDINYVACICAGMANIDRCFEMPFESGKMNVEAPLALLEYLRPFKATPVYYSSDNVFDGSLENYSEKAPLLPSNLYGRQKARVEQAVATGAPRFLILRMSKVLAVTPGGLLFEQRESLRTGREIRCCTDLKFAPVLADDVSRFIVEAIASGESGVFNLAQDQYMSRFEQALMLASRLELPENLVLPCLVKDLRLKESRPRTVRLLNAKAKQKLGFKFTDSAQMIERLR